MWVSDYQFDSSTVMMMSGECIKELSTDEASYERALESDVVGRLNAVLEVFMCVYVICMIVCFCLCIHMYYQRINMILFYTETIVILKKFVGKKVWRIGVQNT